MFEKELERLELIVDTREQPNAAFRARLNKIGLPYTCEKLDYGDYSIRIAGSHDFRDKFVIERKMSLDEIAANLTRERRRFEAELQRAAADNAKVYLVIENGSFEKIAAGDYRSQLKPKAFMASLMTMAARYNVSIQFCSRKLCGHLIRAILYYEARQYLKAEFERQLAELQE